MSPSVPATVTVSISVHGFVGGAFHHADHDITLPAEHATLRGVFDYCRDRLDLDVWEILELNERLQQNVMVNGQRQEVPAGLDEALPDGAQVSLLSPLAGG